MPTTHNHRPLAHCSPPTCRCGATRCRCAIGGTDYVVTRRPDGHSRILRRERMYEADDRLIAARDAEYYGTFGNQS